MPHFLLITVLFVRDSVHHALSRTSPANPASYARRR